MSSIPPKTTVEASKGMARLTPHSEADEVVLVDVGSSRGEAAVYISQLSGELAALARQYRLDSVAYFLEMARKEATSIEKRDR